MRLEDPFLVTLPLISVFLGLKILELCISQYPLRRQKLYSTEQGKFKELSTLNEIGVMRV